MAASTTTAAPWVSPSATERRGLLGRPRYTDRGRCLLERRIADRAQHDKLGAVGQPDDVLSARAEEDLLNNDALKASSGPCTGASTTRSGRTATKTAAP